jgi:LysR family cys regulon transcriptional activator
MNLQQLRYVCAVVKEGFSVTRAAQALHTSQPGISQQINALEKELGLALFVRERKRLTGLTAAGQEIVSRAESALLDIGFIREYAAGVQEEAEGTLVIATTHTQARYVLPDAMKRFSQKRPHIRLTLKHGNPDEITRALITGDAHIGVISVTQPPMKDILVLECRRHQRVVVVARRHPLLRQKRLTLEAIARYPIVTYEQSVGARRQVLNAFDKASIPHRIIVSAIDADVIKRCVEVGLGIAILPDIAVDPARDDKLRSIAAGHLFPPSVTGVVIHRKHHVPKYALDFVEIFAPQWKRAEIERMVSGGDAVTASSKPESSRLRA